MWAIARLSFVQRKGLDVQVSMERSSTQLELTHAEEIAVVIGIVTVLSITIQHKERRKPLLINSLLAEIHIMGLNPVMSTTYLPSAPP